LAQAEQDINICLLTVVTASVSEDSGDRTRYMSKLTAQRQSVLEKFIHYAVEHNVPMYSKLVSGPSIGEAIINDVDAHRNTKLVLINRPERYIPGHLSKESARMIIDGTRTNVGIMVDRGLGKIENIIVPVGRGPHSQLAIHLANDIAVVESAHVDYVRVLPAYKDEEYFEDEMAFLQEMVITELGQLPPNAGLRLLFSDDIASAVIDEAGDDNCDLIISGLSVGYGETENLFGKIADQIAERAGCSVLVLKRYETATTTWLRRQARRLDI
jgi:nucleotide-binding universal stress UspA family protein